MFENYIYDCKSDKWFTPLFGKKLDLCLLPANSDSNFGSLIRIGRKLSVPYYFGKYKSFSLISLFSSVFGGGL